MVAMQVIHMPAAAPGAAKARLGAMTESRSRIGISPLRGTSRSFVFLNPACATPLVAGMLRLTHTVKSKHVDLHPRRSTSFHGRTQLEQCADRYVCHMIDLAKRRSGGYPSLARPDAPLLS